MVDFLLLLWSLLHLLLIITLMGDTFVALTVSFGIPYF